MMLVGSNVHVQQLCPAVRHGVIQVLEALRRRNVDRLRRLLAPGGGGLACVPGAEGLFLALEEPIVVAVRLAFAEGVEILLKHGASPTLHNQVTQDTLLHETARLGGSDPALDIARMLCAKAPALVNQWNRLGETPLHIAAQQPGIAATDMVRFLLMKGADVGIATRHGITPFMRARNPRMVVAMARTDEGQASLNAADFAGRTAVYWAASRGNFYVLLALLFKGADFSLAANPNWGGLMVRTSLRDTPLLAAAVRESERCFGLLLAFGARLERCAHRGSRRAGAADQDDEAATRRIEEVWGGYARSASKFGHLVKVVPTVMILRVIVRCGSVDPEDVSCPTSASGIAAVVELARQREGGDGPLVAAVKEAYGLRRGPSAGPAVLTGWSPKVHQLYHVRFREAIRTMLMIKPRLCTRRPDLPHLPVEVWHAVLGMLARRDFPARFTLLQN